MNDVLELFLLMVAAVSIFTIIYRVTPFRHFEGKRPRFVMFPKYIASFDRPVSEIETALEKNGFTKVNEGIYSRGKIYGDFSAKAIKLTVEVDGVNSCIKVNASTFGILFDTGDIWQVCSDIVNG